VATKLYAKFEGDLSKLTPVLQLLQDKWLFPHTVFHSLWITLRRTIGEAGDMEHISEEQWCDTFFRWLQALRVRCRKAKVSRKCFVQNRSDDLQKVYLRGAKLGEGSYGEVYLMLHTALGVGRVMKIVPKANLGLAEEEVEAEVTMLKSLDHPHIVRVYEVFETEDKLNIVMDYAQGGDLATAIRCLKDDGGSFPENWIRSVIEQVGSALSYMHGQGMIHCDMKPGNTMLLEPWKPGDNSPPHALLCDFGLAELFEERGVGGPKTVKGTPAYLAPEGFDGRLSSKSDMWAVGVMTYELLLLKRPFKSTCNVFQLYCEVTTQRPDFSEVPAEPREVVEALMAKTPKDRPTAAECLNFPWFASPESPTGLPQEKCAKPATLGHVSFFHRAAMFCISAGLSIQEKKELYTFFKTMDVDKSGSLTIEELTAGLAKLGIQQDPVTLMAILDLDQDGRVSYTEFLAGALGSEQQVSDKLVCYAFDLFDMDNDGSISMDELRRMLTGDGPLVDVLPDGKTVEAVMEEVAQGEDRITLAQFRDYVNKAWQDNNASPAVNFLPQTSAGSVMEIKQSQDTRLSTSPTLALEELETVSQEESEVPSVAFPAFDHWLESLYEETDGGTSWSFLLRFADREREVAYIAQYLKKTREQVALLALVLFIYSVWAVSIQDWEYLPSIDDWHHKCLVANNTGWLMLGLSGLLVAIACKTWPWTRSTTMRRQSSELRGNRALCFERSLCAWGCFLPWVSCHLANRTRACALFGMDATDVFDSISSDYTLIIVMLGVLMFFSMRTNMRLVCLFLISGSCFLAYASSSIVLMTGRYGCDEMEGSCSANRAWPMILLAITASLGLSGQSWVEYQRRLTFLSLFASYTLLRDTQNLDADCAIPDFVTTQAMSRTSRLRKATRIVREFSERMSDSPALQGALRRILEVLESVHTDVSSADRRLAVDLDEKLEKLGIGGPARDVLLNLFDMLPSAPGPIMADSFSSAAPPQVHRSETDGSKRSFGGVGVKMADPVEPWGAPSWDSFSVIDSQGPLLAAGTALLVPAAAAAALASVEADGKSDNEAADVRSAARSLLEALSILYRRRAHTAEARAALTMRATHWLAHKIGLWEALSPWERVALLVAAAGIHCGTRGQGFVSEDPLLERASNLSEAMHALEVSGLATFGDAVQLSGLVRRLLARNHPVCLMDDTRRVRRHLEEDIPVLETPTELAAVSSLVLLAADLAFLALPQKLHSRWASVCQDSFSEPSATISSATSVQAASSEAFDLAPWFRGLIEVLALPAYETLLGFSRAKDHLIDPVKHLRANSSRWKDASLLVRANSSTHSAEAVENGQEDVEQDVELLPPAQPSATCTEDLEASQQEQPEGFPLTDSI